MSYRVNVAGEVKLFSSVAAAKASLNRANKYMVVDPKLGDLAMSRLKLG